MENWSDYPIFMAIAETGSLTAAGAKLGISQPTVGRRLKALEDNLGGAVLKKDSGRLVPTTFGHKVLEHVNRMNDEAAAISRSSATLDHSLSGPLVIAAGQGTGDNWLPYAMRGFINAHPDILLDISVDMHSANLAQREADIALRWLGPGTQNSLIGRKAVSVGFGLYASPDYLDRRGRPQNPDDLADHDGVTILLDGHDLLWKETLGTVLAQPRRFSVRANSTQAHKNALASGFGIGPLAHCSVGRLPLVRVLPTLEKTLDLWVVAHEDLKKSARVRAAFDYLVTALHKDKAHLRFGKNSVFECACTPPDNRQTYSDAAQ